MSTSSPLVYVMTMSESYHDPSDEDVRRCREAFLAQFDGVEPRPRLVILAPGLSVAPLFPASAGTPAAQMERLLMLLGLAEQERAFVRAALEPDATPGLWSVLADYLEEKGEPAAPRFRRLHPPDEG